MRQCKTNGHRSMMWTSQNSLRRSLALGFAVAALGVTTWRGATAADDATAPTCAALDADIRSATNARRDVDSALAAHMDLTDVPAFDALQRALDVAEPIASQCREPRSLAAFAALGFARDRFAFGYAPVIPPADPTCANVPTNPTTQPERLRVAQCEYGTQLRDVATTELYLERRTLLTKLQTHFDTLTAESFDHTDSAEYASDRAFLAAARSTLAAEALALPSHPAASPAPTPTTSAGASS